MTIWYALLVVAGTAAGWQLWQLFRKWPRGY